MGPKVPPPPPPPGGQDKHPNNINYNKPKNNVNRKTSHNPPPPPPPGMNNSKVRPPPPPPNPATSDSRIRRQPPPPPPPGIASGKGSMRSSSAIVTKDELQARKKRWLQIQKNRYSATGKRIIRNLEGWFMLRKLTCHLNTYERSCLITVIYRRKRLPQTKGRIWVH